MEDTPGFTSGSLMKLSHSVSYMIYSVLHPERTDGRTTLWSRLGKNRTLLLKSGTAVPFVAEMNAECIACFLSFLFLCGSPFYFTSCFFYLKLFWLWQNGQRCCIGNDLRNRERERETVNEIGKYEFNLKVSIFSHPWSIIWQRILHRLNLNQRQRLKVASPCLWPPHPQLKWWETEWRPRSGSSVNLSEVKVTEGDSRVGCHDQPCPQD